MPALTRRLALLGLMTPALAACNRGNSDAASTGPVPDDMSLGNPAAKVTVVEYASVACPVCGRWYKEVWPAFKAKYIDTGKIHYVFREMLVGDQNEEAIAASGFLLARCAGKDKYFSVVDAVFKSQPGLFSDPNTVLFGVARTIGLSEAQYDACVRNESALNALTVRVQNNATNGKVDATPTFVINGKALDAGYQPLTAIDAAIAAAQAA
ncbi:MAG TPA: thioredoxin domain-containing protein [Caulobacteraceae bacterium]